MDSCWPTAGENFWAYLSLYHENYYRNNPASGENFKVFNHNYQAILEFRAISGRRRQTILKFEFIWAYIINIITEIGPPQANILWFWDILTNFSNIFLN